jgi:para-nitrobenzyl esterase
MITLGNEITPQPVDALVETPQGKLLGVTECPDNKIRAFKGIPYALPPVGNRRWAPPEPAAVWQGTRLAKAYSPQAMQATIFGLPLGQTSEDCLYLNVWTPAKEPSAGFRTVMKRCWKLLLPDRIVLIG